MQEGSPAACRSMSVPASRRAVVTLVKAGLPELLKFLTCLVEASRMPPTVASSLHMHSTSSGLGLATCGACAGGRGPDASNTATARGTFLGHQDVGVQTMSGAVSGSASRHQAPAHLLQQLLDARVHHCLRQHALSAGRGGSRESAHKSGTWAGARRGAGWRARHGRLHGRLLHLGSSARFSC